MPLLKRIPLYWLVLLAGALLVRLSIFMPGLVERYYSSGIYPVIGKSFRVLFGWLPFSFGDLLYIAAGIWLLAGVYRLFRGFWNKTKAGNGRWAGVSRFIAIILSIYVLFNLFWGINYNRRGIAWQLKFQVKDTASASLAGLTRVLLDKTNAWKNVSRPIPGFGKDREEAIRSYASLKNRYDFLAYDHSSVKPSLFGVIGDYMGYSGYYNPFSGEAQVNTRVPAFLIPYSTCHEIAHQLGYAKENEANFVGFLAARESSDSSMRYSAYLNMFLYANSELRFLDTAAARENYLRLSDPVKKDLAEYRKYLTRYEGSMGDFVDAFYEQYLKLNQQPAGHRTYNKVVLWLLAYYGKYGEI